MVWQDGSWIDLGVTPAGFGVELSAPNVTLDGKPRFGLDIYFGSSDEIITPTDDSPGWVYVWDMGALEDYL